MQCNDIISYGNYVLITGRGGSISIICKETRALLGTFDAHATQITATLVRRQENKFWTACNTGELAVWHMSSMEDIQKVAQSSIHSCKVLNICVVQQFKKCFSLSFDGTICSWDLFVSIYK